jgi:hypothetical protein
VRTRKFVLLVTGLLGAFALAAAGCGGDGEKSAATVTVTTVVGVTNPTGTGSVTTHGRFRYPPAVVDNFMQSCVQGNQDRRAYCACTLDELSDSVSVQDFARIGRSGGKFTPRIQRLLRKAALDCADKL